MPPVNQAAWLPGKSVKPLQIDTAPYTPPGPHQIVVRNGAVATNQVDGGKQLMGDLGLTYIKYPFILGGDVAGTVEEVGSEVKRFQVGDRVIGHAAALVPASADPVEGGFQHYTVIREHMAAPLPDDITFEQGCVLPLCLSTAAYGLFHEDFLALDFPTLQGAVSNNENQQKGIVLITGGASSVGCSAVQLAVAAGYDVVSTASPKNFDYVKKLGAKHVFDYNSPTVIDDLVAASSDQALVGAYAISPGTEETCTAVLQRHSGPTGKFVASAGGGVDAEQLKTYLGTASFIASTIWSSGRSAIKARLAGVQVKFVDCNDICDADGVIGRIYRDFVPQALVDRTLVPAPEPLVLGKGLDKIQEAMDLHVKGVSARKLVVSL